MKEMENVNRHFITTYTKHLNLESMCPFATIASVKTAIANNHDNVKMRILRAVIDSFI